MSKAEASHADYLDFDEIIPYIGGCGRYQVLLFTFLWASVMITSFPAFNQIFFTASPDHWCHVPELANSSLSAEDIRRLTIPWVETAGGRSEHSKCTAYNVDFVAVLAELPDGAPVVGDEAWPTVTCQHGWEFNHTWYGETIVTEWELVCSRAWIAPLSMSMYSVGGIVGTFFMGWIGDRFGRRAGYFVTLGVQLVLGVATSLSPELISFFIFRMLVGTTLPVIYQAPFVLSLELAEPSYHSFISSVIWLFFAVGVMVLPLLAWLTMEWRMLALVTSAPLAIFVLYYWFMPESPRWLVTHSRKEEADIIVRRIAKVNKRQISDALISRFRIPADDTGNQHGNIFEIFKYPNLLKKFIACLICWTLNAVVYVGLTYAAGTSGFIGENPYLVLFFSGAVEGIGYLMAWPAMQIVGRRWSTTSAMVVCGAACFLLLAVPKDMESATIVIAMVAKFMITISFAIIYAFSAEQFPTTLRSVCIGVCGLFANIGIMVTPQIVALVQYSSSIPLVIFGVMSILGGVVVLYLPETLNESLPETSIEANNFGKDQKCWSFSVKRYRKSEVISRVAALDHHEMAPLATKVNGVTDETV